MADPTEHKLGSAGSLGSIEQLGSAGSLGSIEQLGSAGSAGSLGTMEEKPRFPCLGEPENKTVVPENYMDVILSLPRDKSWMSEWLYQYQGFWYDQFWLDGIMWFQQNFKARNSDILLISQPKCGTTWLKALMFAIANRTRYDSNSQPLLTRSPHDCLPFIEQPGDRDDLVAYLDSLPSPRLLSTHISYTSLPNSFWNCGSGARVVYLARNPKDVLVSLCEFSKATRANVWDHLPPVEIEEAYEFFCKGISFSGPFWDHVLGYWKASLEAPDKVLFLKYEDMKMDTESCVKRLAEFMGQPFSLEEQRKGVVQEIIQLCSFKNLTSLEVNKSQGNKEFFRRGEVGDSKNHLTPEMLKHLDDITEEKFGLFGLNFLQY